MATQGREITIIGAGFSGLTLAYELTKRNIPIQILEKKENVGGLLQTIQSPEMRSEAAANALLLNEQVHQLFQDLNLPYVKTKKESRRRYFYQGQGLTQWPLSLAESFSFAIKLIKILIQGFQSIKPSSFESIHHWGLKHFGRAFTDSVLSTGLQGIYAASAQDLSASLVLGRFFEKTQKNKKFRGSVSPATGMGELMKALKKYLLAKNVKFIKEEFRSLSSYDQPLVLATSLKDAEPFLKELGISTVDLEKISVAKVTVSFEKPSQKISGFGVLIDQKLQMKTLGVLSNTMIFENSGSLYNESWILRFDSSDKLLSITDQQMINLIQKERKILLGSEDQIQSYSISKWPETLPLYDLVLEKWIQDLKKMNLKNSKGQKIYLTGNYLGSIGLSQIYKQNIQLAQQIEKDFQNATS